MQGFFEKPSRPAGTSRCGFASSSPATAGGGSGWGSFGKGKRMPGFFEGRGHSLSGSATVVLSRADW